MREMIPVGKSRFFWFVGTPFQAISQHNFLILSRFNIKINTLKSFINFIINSWKKNEPRVFDNMNIVCFTFCQTQEPAHWNVRCKWLETVSVFEPTCGLVCTAFHLSVCLDQKWAIPTPESESSLEPTPILVNLESESESESIPWSRPSLVWIWPKIGLDKNYIPKSIIGGCLPGGTVQVANISKQMPSHALWTYTSPL